MLALYHGANSVCSIKVRIVLAEKGLDWTSRHIDLPKGEQFSPSFLKINPNANVPVLDHDGKLVFESSVIAEYLDGLSDQNPLRLSDPFLAAKTRTLGIYSLAYHDAVNTLTFSSYQRAMLRAKPAQELAARFKAMPNQIRARKLADLVARGVESDHVPIALDALTGMCAWVEGALEGDWLMGDFSVADTLLPAYFYRLDCIGLAPLWQRRFPKAAAWYARVTARPSFTQATAPYIDTAQLETMRGAGAVFHQSSDLKGYFE